MNKQSYKYLILLTTSLLFNLSSNIAAQTNNTNDQIISLDSIDDNLKEAYKNLKYNVQVSERIARNTLLFSYELNYDYGIAHSNYIIASALSDSEFNKSEDYLIISSEYAKKINDSRLIARIEMLKGNINWYAKDFNESELRYKESEKLFKSIKNDSSIASVYNSLGILYSSQRKDSLALTYYNKSIQINQRFSNNYNLAINYINLGNFYLNRGAIYQAEDYLFKSLEVSQMGFSRLTPVIYTNLSQLNLNKKDFEKTIYYSHKSLNLLKANDYNGNAYSNKLLSEAFEQKSNFDSAYFYQKKYNYYNEKNFESQLDIRLIEKESEFVFQQKLKQKELTELKNQKRNLLILVTLLVSISVLILLYLIQYNRLIKKQKINDYLKNEKVKLLESLSSKRRESIFDKLKIKRKNDIINQTLQSINLLNKEFENETQKELSNKIISKLNFHKKYNGWLAFEKDFLQVHPNFIKKLNQKYPRLTHYEIRLCSFLKMNMSSKEISDILNITNESVVKSRTRLRKKLGITGTKKTIISLLNNL
ncbi:tetratricopeptide repeat protein [Ulvibacter litoralis]|uniref:Uncharacterized protein n=1 Tax=Ulvibacter litoralis TaxID=227084 RepID=A0A1G7JPJ2_9FLAO|nr:tetratricopeptide repeat protein [Ulvibacter litoralis]GHC65678.1 hypothetical protein GCM10008083_33580 [Ulvibacter litoralis]SDF26833.1 hypothetical protein SAMN05421855_1221 [Ulvibacter litoralis]